MKLAEVKRSDTKCQDGLPWARACPWPEELRKAVAEDGILRVVWGVLFPFGKQEGMFAAWLGFGGVYVQVVFDNRVDRKGL